MKLAFTSCSCIQADRRQPVWALIATQQPDRLLLTGDQIYVDATYTSHPKTWPEYPFLGHLGALYRAQLAVPAFASLIATVPADAIWDDHDFLWNEHYREKAIEKKVYRGHVRATRAAFRAFVEALGRGGAPGYPASDADPALNRPGEPPPGYRWRDLGAGLRLHLTDGRSWRIRRTLLGAEQRRQIAQSMDSSPAETVHLLASGSVLRNSGLFGERWDAFEDFHWLKALALRHRILVLSGDLHENRFDAIEVAPGRWLFDATASGAAVRKGVLLGGRRCNHGLLEADATHLTLTLHESGTPSHGTPLRIERQRWLRA